MLDEQLIHELKQIHERDDEQAHTKRSELIQAIKTRSFYYQRGTIGKGINLLKQARQAICPLPDLDQSVALILGSRAELHLHWTDQLKVIPSEDVLSHMVADLTDALQTDASVPDLYWDMAVILARFYADYDTASQYLTVAITLGYQHGRMEQLITLIRSQPPLPPSPETDENQLRQLILRLAVYTTELGCPVLSENEESKGLVAGGKGSVNSQTVEDQTFEDQTFEDYVTAAKAIAAHHTITQEQFLEILENSLALGGDATLKTAELLYYVADFLQEEPLLEQVTDRYLRQVERIAAIELHSQHGEDVDLLRVAAGIKKYGLDIVASSSTKIDPNLVANLLVYRGNALLNAIRDSHPLESNFCVLPEALHCYQRALMLKQQVNATDLERLQEFLWQHIKDICGRSMIFPGYLEPLRVCAELVDHLGSAPPQCPSATYVKLLLATKLREAGQYDEAEPLIVTILNSNPSPYFVRASQFELASIYGETGRQREAAAIQRAWLDDKEWEDNETRAKLWGNYANSLQSLQDYEGALTALGNAWELLPPNQKQKLDNSPPLLGFWIKTLYAQTYFEMGNYPEAINAFNEAELLKEVGIGAIVDDNLRFSAIKAECFMKLNQFDEVLKCLNVELHNLKFRIKQVPSLYAWECLLQKWTHLDDWVIRSQMQGNSADCFEKALLHAEATKGRITAWLDQMTAPDGASRALDVERQVEALNAARQWLGRRSQRRIISLLASSTGLGIFNINDQGEIQATWLEDFNYDRFCKDVYEPWENAVARGLETGESDILALASSQSNYLLDLVGTWLWRSQPDLVEGGTDLVLIPHRLFRNLPLIHARLPNGQLLSDLFERAVIVPSLTHLERSLKSSTASGQTPITALADADYSLQFARGEALLSGAGTHSLLGHDVTAEVVKTALGQPGILLLSMHGDFDEDDPFQSVIYTAEGSFSLNELLLDHTPVRCQIVVLGVCEAGRSRRSIVDEPIGFPTMLLQGGVQAVLAPAWKVDDLASFFFITKLFEATNQGNDIVRATQDTARWLRQLTAKAALERLLLLIERLESTGEPGREVVENVEPKLARHRNWLEKGLAPNAQPFRSPLDWAAFQITGLPLMTEQSHDQN